VRSPLAAHMMLNYGVCGMAGRVVNNMKLNYVLRTHNIVAFTFYCHWL